MPCSKQPKYESERLFAAYLDAAGVPWEYELDIPGQSKKPDFAVQHNGAQILCEVKARYPSDAENTAATEESGVARYFDPVAQTRRLLKMGLGTFQHFERQLCVLVIYNQGNRDTRLNPTTIYASLLGNPGFWANLTSDGTVDPGSIQSGYLEWHGTEARRYETTGNVSAIVALDTYRIPNRDFAEAFDEEVAQQKERLKRALTARENLAIRQELMLDRGLLMSTGDVPGLPCP